MAEVSPVDRALFAFRKRDKSFVLTGATVAYLVLSLTLSAGLFALMWPALQPVIHWYIETIRGAMHGGAEPSMPPADALMHVAPWYGLFGLLALVLFAAYEAACLRWLVRGERGGLLGLSLGPDTWRVFATYFVWLALVIAFACVTAAIYVGLNAVSQAAPAVRILVMLVGALAPLALFALLILGAVRLSPAAAASIAKKRFAFFDAWAATRGQFWELLGAFIVLFVAYLVIHTVFSVLIRIPMTQAMIPLMREAATDGDIDRLLQQMAHVFTTPMMAALLGVYVVVAMVLSSLLYIAWFGVNAQVFAGGEPAAAPASAPRPAPPPPPPAVAPAPPAVAESPPAPAVAEPPPAPEAQAAPEPAPPPAEETSSAAPEPAPQSEEQAVPEPGPPTEPSAPESSPRGPQEH